MYKKLFPFLLRGNFYQFFLCLISPLYYITNYIKVLYYGTYNFNYTGTFNIGDVVVSPNNFGMYINTKSSNTFSDTNGTWNKILDHNIGNEYIKKIESFIGFQYILQKNFNLLNTGKVYITINDINYYFEVFRDQNRSSFVFRNSSKNVLPIFRNETINVNKYNVTLNISSTLSQSIQKLIVIFFNKIKPLGVKYNIKYF